MTEPRPLQIDTWQKAEQNAAAWMRYWGFKDAKVTQGGADGGVDVRSRRAIAQVKHEAALVGRPVVQRLAGARGSNYDLALFFFSGVGFTRGAIEFADEVDMALFKYSLSGARSPANRSARAFLRTIPAAVERAAAERAAQERAAAERSAAQRAAQERLDRERLDRERAAQEDVSLTYGVQMLRGALACVIHERGLAV